ncbi:hypothetical protein [Pedobacter antarcticus]|uniref:hypothetical protein n=1 Tax=Pedobacter antarcticus TaxID=34086 RepID=UPI0008921CAD|nr:hypothetical protein [Pedobacter antarcticus]SDM40380.1 hypothetical protein SAMN04488084_106164 [Pedobacter antarcticus]
MKIIENFDNLDKANTYVTAVNTELANATAKVTENTEALKQLTAASKTATVSINDLTNQLAVKNEQLDEALSEIAELGKKLAIQEEHGSDGLIVYIGKKSYHLIGDSFIYNGETKTAKELSQDDAQLQKMLKLNSGSLVEISAS